MFWHTLGTGKSIFMCCCTDKLLQRSAMKNPTLVVVSDRNKLNGEMYQRFCMARDALANNQSAVREPGDELLQRPAKELTENLRSGTTVG